MKVAFTSANKSQGKVEDASDKFEVQKTWRSHIVSWVNNSLNYLTIGALPALKAAFTDGNNYSLPPGGVLSIGHKRHLVVIFDSQLRRQMAAKFRSSSPFTLNGCRELQIFADVIGREGVILTATELKEKNKLKSTTKKDFSREQLAKKPEEAISCIKQTLSKKITLGQTQDLTALSRSLSSRILLKLIFNRNSPIEGLEEAVVRTEKVISDRIFMRPGYLASFLSSSETDAAKAGLNHAVDTILNEKKVVVQKIQNAHPTVTEEYLRYLLFVGSGTIGSALASIMYNLIKYPRYQELIQREIHEIDEEDEDLVNKLEDLPILKAFIHETLRLEPPVLAQTRCLSEAILIDGHRIEAGTSILLNHYFGNRREEEWGKSSAEFLPERYHVIDGKGKLAPNQDNPKLEMFSSGHSLCHGIQYAGVVLKVALFTFLKKYNLNPPLDAAGNAYQQQLITVASMTQQYNEAVKGRIFLRETKETLPPIDYKKDFINKKTAPVST